MNLIRSDDHFPFFFCFVSISMLLCSMLNVHLVSQLMLIVLPITKFFKNLSIIIKDDAQINTSEKSSFELGAKAFFYFAVFPRPNLINASAAAIKPRKLSMLLLCKHRIISSKWMLVENNARRKKRDWKSIICGNFSRTNSNFALYFRLFGPRRRYEEEEKPLS